MVMLVSAVERKGDAADAGARRPYPRTIRLLRHADFQRVYQQGRRHFSAHMTVFYLKRESGEHARVGYTVSRAMGGAVDRNRMKRRLREAVRLTWPGFATPVDIVINPKKSLVKAPFDDLLMQVSRAFEQIQRSNVQ
jgi:ribonuclease P protein component